MIDHLMEHIFRNWFTIKVGKLSV